VIVNWKFQPPEYRPSIWCEVIIVIALMFFGIFFTLFVLTLLLGIKVN